MYFTQIERIARPGRKVANAFQGKLSADFVEVTLRKAKAEPDAVVNRLEKIFQPGREIQEVVVPYFPEFFELISNNEPLIYKGVSFNPFVSSFGENVNILDFYSWVKRSRMKGIILDASLYAIVNAAKQPLVEIFSPTAAEDAVEFLKSRMDSYPDIKKSAETREKYLRASATSLFAPADAPLVISAEEIWERKKYIECLQKAIEFCCGNPPEGERLEIISYADYTRYGSDYQRWYTVLVLAEVLYLNQIYGVNIKLGPTSESNFDNMIKKFMKDQGIPFAFVWYNREIEKSIPYPERLSFDDGNEELKEKLSNERLGKWVEEIIGPFAKEGEKLTETVSRVIRQVKKTTEKNLPRLDAEGEWFLTFPPGECN